MSTSQPREEVRVRARRHRHLSACSRLVRLVEFEGHDLGRGGRRPPAWLEAPDVLAAWVATGGGAVLGHVALSSVPPDIRAAHRWRELTGHAPGALGCVSRLFVRPRSRRTGVGTALLSRATSEIHARGRLPVLETPGRDAETEMFLTSCGWRLQAVDVASDGDGGRVSRYAFPTAVGAEVVGGRVAGPAGQTLWEVP